ncbi:MAG: hypothetical protein J6V09_02000 [Clostridia bacterium]|nr:hypothetical protein [Clostridia bacterium]
MFGVVLVEAIAIATIVMGILIMCGKTSLIHSYHRDRVAAKNEMKFARGVGSAILVIGIGAFMLGALMLPTVLLKNKIYLWCGFAAFTVCFIIGLILAFLTTKKYNGKIM